MSNVGISTGTIHPSLDLSRRKLPDFTRQLLLARKQLHLDSLTQDTITAKGKWAGGIDGLYVYLRGESTRKSNEGEYITLIKDPLQSSEDSIYTPSKISDAYSLLNPDRVTIPPTLKTVTVTSGGTYGALWTIEASIVCYNKEDLKQIETFFLVPANKICLAAGSVKGWMEHNEKGSKLEVPRGWTRGQNLEFACRVVSYTFGFDQGRWTCTFKAVGLEDLFNNLVIPYTLEGRDYTFINGRGERVPASGIAQALYFIDAVGNETSSLTFNTNKVIQNFTKYKGTRPPGAIVSFQEKYWANTHFARTDSNTGGTAEQNSRDQIQCDFSVRVYFTLEYIVNRLMNDLVLGNILVDKAFTEKSIQDIFRDGKWYVGFDEEDERSTTRVKVPSAAELPFLSANPGEVILLGRADYTSEDGRGVDFTKLVSGPLAVQGDEVNIKNILIHGSVIEQAVINSTQIKSIKGENGANQYANLITVSNFFGHIASVVSKCTGKFIALNLVRDSDLEDLKSAEVPTYLKHSGEQSLDKYPCVKFDPLKGDGNTRDLTITSGQGSEEYTLALLQKGMQEFQGDTGTFLRDDQGTPEVKQEEVETKQTVQQSIKTIQPRLGQQGFLEADVSEALSLFTKYYTYYYNTEERVGQDSNDKLLLYPALGLNVRLHGISGFKQGHFISCTTLPPAYEVGNPDALDNGNGMPFFITAVTHTFNLDVNDWETSLQAIAGISAGLELIDLSS